MRETVNGCQQHYCLTSLLLHFPLHCGSVAINIYLRHEHQTDFTGSQSAHITNISEVSKALHLQAKSNKLLQNKKYFPSPAHDVITKMCEKEIGYSALSDCSQN